MNFTAFSFSLFFSFSGFPESAKPPVEDTCPDRPSVEVKKVVLADGDDEYNEYLFSSTVGEEPVILKHLCSWYQADCNSVQAILGHYEWQHDTLVLYKFWCHDGDYTGKEWGACRTRYKWLCQDDALEKIDAIVYIESLSDDGGAPLSTEEMADQALLQDREDFKRHTARREDATFVIGKEARALIKETTSAMKSILGEVEASFDCEQYGFGCRVWE